MQVVFCGPFGLSLCICKKILQLKHSTRVRGCADNSLARPGRKQGTATKVLIFSIYCTRSSIHFLASCSSFCKPPKKVQNVVRPKRSPWQQWPSCRKKNCDISIVFTVQGKIVIQRGQIRRTGWVIKTLETQTGQFLLFCKCPVSRSIGAQEQDHLG